MREQHSNAFRPEVVLFDFDFTLVDSSKPALACIGYALDRLGLALVSDIDAQATIGLSLNATFEQLTGITDADQRAAFRGHFIEHADRVMVRDTSSLPDAAETVRVLRSRGYRLGIVSTKFRHRIESILTRHGLREAFEMIIGAEDVSAHKPDPAGLNVALERIGVVPARSLYVGDHVVDAQAASGVPMPFVAVLSGTTERSEFEPYAPVKILDTVAQLPRVLN